MDELAKLQVLIFLSVFSLTNNLLTIHVIVCENASICMILSRYRHHMLIVFKENA